jgi:site-specific DNA-cytosine methylase
MSKRVLVGCEMSGVVRQAFRAQGCDAWSCDLVSAEDGSPHHLRCDVFKAIEAMHWHALIVFPPCTDLAVSGARWFKEKQRDGRQQRALDFVRRLLEANIQYIALENPVSIISSRIRKPDQIIQPWQFGHGEVKTTCLWLKNLPPLRPTQLVTGRVQRVWRMGPSPTRHIDRARTYSGIATAMATQWSVSISSKGS